MDTLYIDYLTYNLQMIFAIANPGAIFRHANVESRVLRLRTPYRQYVPFKYQLDVV